MLSIIIKGGLGNQLFQYAFGRFLSSKREEELKLDNTSMGNIKDTSREYKLDNFNIKASIALTDEIKKLKNPLGIFSVFTNIVKTKIDKSTYGITS